MGGLQDCKCSCSQSFKRSLKLNRMHFKAILLLLLSSSSCKYQACTSPLNLKFLCSSLYCNIQQLFLPFCWVLPWLLFAWYITNRSDFNSLPSPTVWLSLKIVLQAATTNINSTSIPLTEPINNWSHMRSFKD